MKTKLDESIARLAKAARRLRPDQGRIARRNARRAVTASLVSVGFQMDKLFPVLSKPQKRKPPSPARQSTELPFRRKFVGNNQLFCELAAHALNILNVPTVRVHEGAQFGNYSWGATIYVAPTWSDDRKWKQVLGYFVTKRGGLGGIGWPIVIDLWRRYWSEPIPVPDLRVMAKHQVFLEQREKRGVL